MLNQIITSISPLIQSLPFVERYGGLVQVIEKKQLVSEELQIYETIKFPITCNADATCFHANMYAPIVPNSMYKSVFYFEELQSMRYTETEGPKNSVVCYEGKIRLVGWLNLQKLGIEGCQYACDAYACILAKQFGLIGMHDMPLPYEKAKFAIGYPNIVPKTPAIFSKYSYNDIIKCLIYPYDYFALDFPVKVKIAVNCIDCVEPNEPIECLTV